MSSHTPADTPAAPNEPPRPPPNRRRDKKQRSCDFCRKRKLRCDRRQPCAACTARSRACIFPDFSAYPSPPKSTPRPHLTLLEERVRYLEGLIQSTVTAVRSQEATCSDEASSSLADAASSTSRPSSSPRQGPVSEPGTMRMGAKGTVYIGSPHWAAIIDGVSELKDHFGRMDKIQASTDVGVESTGPAPNRPLLLYHCSRQMTKAQLLCALPERSAVDRLIFRYFNETEVLPMRIVHPGNFIQQYEAFWASNMNPSMVSIHWLGLVFSMMTLATVFTLKSNQESMYAFRTTEASTPQPGYIAEVVQCLIGGDYIRGGPYVLETLIHYCMIETFMPPHSEVSGWMVSGLATQVALRMGYHRDPSHFPEISPFDGEMRRRVWTMIQLGDTTLSMLVGAPRLISDGSWDTKPPLNLNDADLDAACAQLPPPRPDDERTTMSFSLARYKLGVSLGWLLDASVSNDIRTPAQMQRAESRLEAAWDSIPERFKFRSLAHCLSDTPVAIAQRMGITCLHNKLLIMLHRCHLLGSSTSSGPSFPPPDAGTREYEYCSRRVCVGAALQNVQYLILLDAETRDGGSLAVLRTKLSALVIHEFLVATAVLGTYLYKFGVPLGGVEGSADGIDARELEATLRQCREPWVQLSSWSEAAKRASGMLDLLFRKLEGNAANAPVNEFSTALDGMGLNLAWDSDIFGAFGDLAEDAF